MGNIVVAIFMGAFLSVPVFYLGGPLKTQTLGVLIRNLLSCFEYWRHLPPHDAVDLLLTRAGHSVGKTLGVIISATIIVGPIAYGALPDAAALGIALGFAGILGILTFMFTWRLTSALVGAVAGGITIALLSTLMTQLADIYYQLFSGTAPANVETLNLINRGLVLGDVRPFIVLFEQPDLGTSIAFWFIGTFAVAGILAFPSGVAVGVLDPFGKILPLQPIVAFTRAVLEASKWLGIVTLLPLLAWLLFLFSDFTLSHETLLESLVAIGGFIVLAVFAVVHSRGHLRSHSTVQMITTSAIFSALWWITVVFVLPKLFAHSPAAESDPGSEILRLVIATPILGIPLIASLFAMFVLIGMPAIMGAWIGRQLRSGFQAFDQAGPYIRNMAAPTIGFMGVYGAIVLWFGGAYAAIHQAIPSAFKVSADSAAGQQLIGTQSSAFTHLSLGEYVYFSLSTMTLFGAYSPLEPVSPLVRVAVGVQMLFGLLLTVAVFAAVLAYLQPIFSRTASRSRTRAALAFQDRYFLVEPGTPIPVLTVTRVNGGTLAFDLMRNEPVEGPDVRIEQLGSGVRVSGSGSDPVYSVRFGVPLELRLTLEHGKEQCVQINDSGVVAIDAATGRDIARAEAWSQKEVGMTLMPDGSLRNGGTVPPIVARCLLGVL